MTFKRLGGAPANNRELLLDIVYEEMVRILRFAPESDREELAHYLFEMAIKEFDEGYGDSLANVVRLFGVPDKFRSSLYMRIKAIRAQKKGRRLTPNQVRGIRDSYNFFKKIAESPGQHNFHSMSGGCRTASEYFEFLANNYGVSKKTIEDVIYRKKTYQNE